MDDVPAALSAAEAVVPGQTEVVVAAAAVRKLEHLTGNHRLLLGYTERWRRWRRWRMNNTKKTKKTNEKKEKKKKKKEEKMNGWTGLFHTEQEVTSQVVIQMQVDVSCDLTNQGDR